MQRCELFRFGFYKNCRIDIVWLRNVICSHIINYNYYVYGIYFEIYQCMIGVYYIIMGAYFLGVIKHITIYTITTTNIAVIRCCLYVRCQCVT